ncbi:MAG: hypothetical protein IT266_02635 [Saprospiraceae bacterium]|nr:hypothetical protein [Saprospiraceae bacterium]
MKKSFSRSLFEGLEPKQRQRFLAFLRSPYFNRQERMVAGVMAMDRLEGLHGEAYARALFATLYPQMPYDDVKLRLFFSELAALLRRFLYVEAMQSSEEEQSLYLLRYLRQRREADAFERLARKLQREFDTDSGWNPRRFEWRHRLEVEKMSYESFRNRFTHFDFNLGAAQLEVASLIQRLRIYLEQLSHEAIGRTPATYPMLDAWINHAIEQGWDQLPELRLYLLATQLFREPAQDGLFHEYLQLLGEQEAGFDFETGRELYLTALNYGIRKINQNAVDFFRISLDLFRHCVKRGWILDYGVMSSLTYKNIIVLCLRMNDLDLAEQLLESYRPLVDARDRAMIYQFCLARIRKERGDFRGALYLLNTSLFKDPLIELNARVEMIKIYYELDEPELMNNQLTATRQLIRRSKKLGYHREYYVNFLAASARLLSLRRPDAQARQAWMDRILADKKLIEKTWLYNMVAQLPVQRTRTEAPVSPALKQRPDKN